MFTTRDLVWGIPIPALIAALAMCIAWRPWRRDSPLAGGYWGGGLAIGAGFATAFLALVRKWPNPQQDATHWLFVIAVISIVVGFADGLFTLPTWIRRCIASCSFLVSCWLLLRTVHGLGSGAVAAWTVSSTLILSVWWVFLDDFARAERGPIVPVLLTIVAGATAVVLMFSGSQLLGQLGGGFAAAVGGCAVVAFRVNSLSLSRGGIFAYVFLVSGLLICGHFYAYLTLVNGLLLMAAGLLTVTGHAVPVRLLHGWKRQLTLIFVVLVPAGTAIILAAMEFAASMSEY